MAKLSKYPFFFKWTGQTATERCECDEIKESVLIQLQTGPKRPAEIPHSHLDIARNKLAADAQAAVYTVK